MRLACLACLAVAACSSHSPPGSNQLALTVVGSPALIAVRDGGGDWREVSGTDGNYSFGTDYDYTLLVTCSDQTGFDTVLLARTTDDGDPFIYCDGHATAFADSVPLAGTMQQAGVVSLYDIQQSATAPWNFTLAVPPGSGDLVAVGNGKAVIRRDLSIEAPGAMQVPPIDVDRDGTPLVPVALALDGIQPGEQLTTEIDLYSRNSISWGPTVEGATVQMLPASLLRPDDDVDLYLEAWGTPYFRTLDTRFDGTVTRYQMMAPIAGVEFTPDGGASWSQLPVHTAVALDLTAGNSAQRVSASETWLAVNGATTLGLDSFGPLPARFQSTWRLDLSQPYSRTFSAIDDSTPIATSSGISEDAGSLQRRQPQDLPVDVTARRVDRRIYEQARHRAVAKP